jgi:hypothetical protein
MKANAATYMLRQEGDLVESLAFVETQHVLAQINAALHSKRSH